MVKKIQDKNEEKKEDDQVNIRVSKVDRDWLLDHRDSKRKGIADVVHEIIEFWEQCQNGP